MGVEAWDRDILAKDEMQLTTDAMEASTDYHSYVSKEALSGGRGFGGGGGRKDRRRRPTRPVGLFT